MITFRKVREDDLELNSKIEDLNIKVFPSTETTSDLHFLENYYKGASVDFIAIEDGLWNCPTEASAGDSRQSPHSPDHLYTSAGQR